jgi:hypothetical protein
MYDPADLRPGDIVLVEGTGPLAAAIKWATDNPFSHAAIVGFGELLEALDRVVASPLGKYQERGWLYRVACLPAQREAAARNAYIRLGMPYGYTALLEDALRYIAHVPLSSRLDPRDLTCSGYVAWCYARAGVTLTYEPLPSPASLSYSPLLLGPRPWIHLGISDGREEADALGRGA